MILSSKDTRYKYTRHKGTGLTVCLLVSSASLCVSIANAAPIYKVVDEQTGQVTFTDRPQNYESQAGKQVSQTNITTGNSRDNRPNPESSNTTQPMPTRATQAAPTTPVTVVNYQLTITEPSVERAYRRPAQSIIVKAQLNPALQAGDSVSIYLDDNEVAQGLSATIATVDVLLGEHKLAVVIKNKEGQTLEQASRTLHVIQNTQTLQNNKRLAQQLLAYEQLPWYQKLLLKMRQDSAE